MQLCQRLQLQFFVSEYVWNEKHKKYKNYRRLSVVAVKQRFHTGERNFYKKMVVVKACGLSYARLYSEIEQRHENEQYYQADGEIYRRG